MSMAKLLKEKKAYGRIRPELLEESKGKWVAICDGKVIVQGNEFDEVVKRAYEVAGGEVFYVTKVGEEQRVERRIYRNRSFNSPMDL
ncbi:MAG: hypothetical protein AOA66_0730 [Candidatus Bathyarchaeota archaeon BA2]|nr:MAG: hypothetical protein AOA66_0730 [Candidatus Bathyarchaeota archaeon BA2]